MADRDNDERSALPWVSWLEDLTKGLECFKRDDSLKAPLLASRPTVWNSPRGYAQDIGQIASPGRRGVASRGVGVRAVTRTPDLAQNGTECGVGVRAVSQAPYLAQNRTDDEAGALSPGASGAAAQRERRMVEVQLDAVAAQIKVLMVKKQAATDLNTQRTSGSLPRPLPPPPAAAHLRPRIPPR